MPNERDYYSILQVNPGASQEAIDAAYTRLSRLYDPEVSRKRKASQRRQQLDEAYDVLKDRKRRAEYDRLRARGWRPGQPVREEGSQAAVFRWLGNPYVFAGLVASGVVVILGAIILISVLGGGEASNEQVINPSGTPAETPPPVTGNEITTDSGLKYVDTQEGTGASPVTGDKLVVNYTGWTQADGKKFDSSLDRHEPFTFPLGAGAVIKAWDLGFAGMKVGGKRRLIVPPDLGYGAAGTGSIPPNATLIFDVELLDINPTPTPTGPAASTPATSGGGGASEPTASP